jgi:hypothetical protein
MGAQRCGNSPVIGRGVLMARLREAHENHDWLWEAERRQSVQRRIDSLETKRHRKSLVAVDAPLAKQMEELSRANWTEPSIPPRCTATPCANTEWRPAPAPSHAAVFNSLTNC